jgi:glycolate oxidase iron-sulfur subunit
MRQSRRYGTNNNEPPTITAHKEHSSLTRKMASSPLTLQLAAEEQKILACIHCGLCLEACPTYTITGDENDGPRGRIYLMRAVAEGRLANNSSSFERHIDRCLGCRACENVCPAGVEYGQLLEAGRAELSEVKQGFTHSVLHLVLNHVWLHPRRLKFAFALSRIFRDLGLARLLLKLRLPRLVSPRFEFALALLDSSAGRSKRVDHPVSSVTSTVSSAFLFKGCVGEGLFSRVNRATTRVLKRNGIELSAPREQVCCGALHAHAGDLEGARKLARQNIKAFEEDKTAIVTNAGGCGAMLTTYHHLLAHDDEFRERAERFSARVRDVSQILQTCDLQKGDAADNARVTYDASCHLMYGQHAADTSVSMLRSIPNLDFVALINPERCCGGAGIYNLLEPDLSGKVLEQKLADIKQSEAEVVATGNPGCQMQIAAGALLSGMTIRVCHPIELLDESYGRGEGDHES